MSKTNQGPKVTPKKVAADSAIDELKKLMASANALIEQVAGAAPEVSAEGEAAAAAEPAAAPAVEATATPAPGDTSADPEAGAPAEPAAAPAVSEGEGGDDVAGLIAQVKAVLAKLEAVGGANAEPAAPAADNVEGLQESSSVQGAQVSVDAEGMPSGAADQEGENLPVSEKAQDTALRNFYADSAIKDSVYQRLSKVVGAFDCRAMDARQVSVYGVKKLGLKCQDGHEMTALNMFLDGRDKGLKAVAATTTKALDSKTAESSELDAYLKGAQ